VAEETEGQGASAVAAGGAAIAIAMGEAARDTSVAGEARIFLREQTAVLRLQREVLEEERRLNLSHLQHRRFGDFTKSALEIAVGLVILLIVCGLGTMVWNAAGDRDLVVDAFSVPPDVAQTGLTGSVLANRVLDRFGDMDRNVRSFTADFSGYHRAPGEDVRVEIPETGISIGELNRYLRAWLGHETHVTGELVRTDKAVYVTLRYGDEPGITVGGAPQDLKRLIQESAENLFRAAQPLRFADYLSNHHRFAEAEAIARHETQVGSDAHRAAAYVSLAIVYFYNGDERALARQGPEAVRLDPKNLAAWFVLISGANNFDHNEEHWRSLNAALPLAKAGTATAEITELARKLPIVFEAELRGLKGDLVGKIETCKGVTGAYSNDCSDIELSTTYALAHDVANARALIDEVPAMRPDGAANTELLFNQARNALAAGNWAQAVALSVKAEAIVAKDQTQFADMDIFLRPDEAEALARSGDVARAEAVIATTPLDCDRCVRARGRIAMIARNWTAAERWFALVSARSPDIPFADTDWGQMLLARGDLNSAIAKFQSANQKGTHFADPIEMWGDALMLKNRSDLALVKFQEGNKYAPNWGRLHLKWGEALMWSGKPDDAKKQFAIATHLDLSAADKAALSRVGGLHR
jgi:tetratricopeptide (TPR) repeat protein